VLGVCVFWSSVVSTICIDAVSWWLYSTLRVGVRVSSPSAVISSCCYQWKTVGSSRSCASISVCVLVYGSLSEIDLAQLMVPCCTGTIALAVGISLRRHKN
jgi:hypothetical protein